MKRLIAFVEEMHILLMKKVLSAQWRSRKRTYTVEEEFGALLLSLKKP